MTCYYTGVAVTNASINLKAATSKRAEYTIFIPECLAEPQVGVERRQKGVYTMLKSLERTGHPNILIRDQSNEVLNVARIPYQFRP